MFRWTLKVNNKHEKLEFGQNSDVKQKINKKVYSLGELWWQTKDKQEGVMFGLDAKQDKCTRMFNG